MFLLSSQSSLKQQCPGLTFTRSAAESSSFCAKGKSDYPTLSNLFLYLYHSYHFFVQFFSVPDQHTGQAGGVTVNRVQREERCGEKPQKNID